MAAVEASDLWDEFSSNTTAHGLSRIHSSQPRWKIILWTMCFVGSTIGCTIILYQNIRDYYKYETFVRMLKLGHANAITILTVKDTYLIAERFHIAQWKLPKSYRELIHKQSTSYRRSDRGNYEVSFCPTLSEHGSARKAAKPYVPPNMSHIPCSDGWSNGFADYTMTEENREALMSGMFSYSASFELGQGAHDSSFLDSLFGLELEDMLAGCFYGPKAMPCSSNDFTEWWHPSFGRCYTFNHTENLGFKGLEMTLYLPIADGQVNAYDAYKYNPMRKFKGIGFIIMIQEPGTMPMTDGGLFTSVGLASYLEVVETVHKRKELPFQTDCTSRTSLPGWDYRYSQAACLAVCNMAAIIRDCGCASAWMTDTLKPPDSDVKYCLQHLCDFDVVEKGRCMEESIQNETCDYCRPPCQESTFTSQIKQIVWPPEDHLPGFLQRLNKSSALYQDLLFQYPADPQMWWMIVEGLNISAIHKNDYIKKNVGIVKIYRAKSKPTVFAEEVEAISHGSLFSNIGGSFGLCIGFSLITFVELLEFVIKILRTMMERRKALLVTYPLKEPLPERVATIG